MQYYLYTNFIPFFNIGGGIIDMKKTSMFVTIVGITAFLFFAAVPIQAVGYSVSFTDSQGDVRDGNGDPTSNPNIDITSLESYKENDNVVFELTVAGSIYTGSDEYMYMVHVGGDAADILQIMYSNDQVMYYSQQDPSDMGQGTYNVDGGKLTIQIPVSAFESENIVLRVQNAYGNLGGSTPDAIDLAPNDGGFSGMGGSGDTEEEDEGDDEEEEDSGETSDDADTNGDGNGEEESEDNGGSSPGFEALLLITAIAIVIIFFKRRK